MKTNYQQFLSEKSNEFVHQNFSTLRDNIEKGNAISFALHLSSHCEIQDVIEEIEQDYKSDLLDWHNIDEFSMEYKEVNKAIKKRLYKDMTPLICKGYIEMFQDAVKVVLNDVDNNDSELRNLTNKKKYYPDQSNSEDIDTEIERIENIIFEATETINLLKLAKRYKAMINEINLYESGFIS